MAKYIPLDALVAEIEKIRAKWFGINNDFADGQKVALTKILSLIDTLEVKEVDLDSDIRTYLTNHFNVYEDGVLQSKKSELPLRTYDIIKIAKHFFELGLQVAQKGE